MIAKANITLFNCDELFPEINLPCSNPLWGGAFGPLETMGDYWEVVGYLKPWVSGFGVSLPCHFKYHQLIKRRFKGHLISGWGLK